MIEFLKSLPKTFYASEFYRALAREGKGIGFGFLVVATLVSILGALPSSLPPLRAFLKEQGTFFAALPPVTLSGGELSIEGEPLQTYSLMTELDGGPFHVVFDINAPTPPEDDLSRKMADEKIVVWVNKTNVFVYDSNKSQLERRNLSGYDDVIVTHEKWMEISSVIANILTPSMLLIMAGSVLFFHFITALLGGFFLLLVAPMFKLSIPFSAGARLAAAAKVPVATVFVLLTPHLLLQLALWFGFAMFGLLSLRPAAEKG